MTKKTSYNAHAVGRILNAFQQDFPPKIVSLLNAPTLRALLISPNHHATDLPYHLLDKSNDNLLAYMIHQAFDNNETELYNGIDYILRFKKHFNMHFDMDLSDAEKEKLATFLESSLLNEGPTT